MLTYIVSVRGGKPKSAATSIEEEPLVPFAEVSLPPGRPARLPPGGLADGARGTSHVQEAWPEDHVRFGPHREGWIAVFVMTAFTLPAAGPRTGAGMIAKIHGSPGRPRRAMTVTRQVLHA
ncbi:hypothetical protein ACFYYN_39320 [Streptomyces sp. NPDC001902]